MFFFLPLVTAIIVFVAAGYFSKSLLRSYAQSTNVSQFIASEDTFIAENSPDNTNGATGILYINNKPGVQRRGLVRFVVSDLPAGSSVTQALVKLYVSNGTRTNESTDSAGLVAKVTGRWTESTATWNNAPAVGDTVGNFLPSDSALAGTWRDADVTSAVTGNGTYDYYLIHNSPSLDDLSYASSESTVETAGIADAQPVLVVNWSAPPTPTPTLTPAPTPTNTPTPAPSTPTPTPIPAISLTHGPLVGGVTNTSAKVFMRTSESTNIRIAYSLNSVYDPSQVTIVGPVLSPGSNDNTAILSIGNLAPETKYYYWVSLADQEPDTSKTYEFTTFSANDVMKDFKFAIFADGSSKDEYDAPSYARAAGFSPAFVGQIGDFRHDDPGVAPTPIQASNWWTQNKKSIGTTPAGNDFAANIGNKLPFFHIWDDHDYGKNNADKNFTYKSLATESFKLFFPTYPLDVNGSGLWQKVRYGKEAVVLVADLRSQRSANGARDTKTKSMFGTTQKQWLKNELLSAQSEGVIWKFIISSSVWNRKSKQEDSWYLYKTEQDEIINYIKSSGIKNVIVIDGDLHSGGAIDDGSGTISCSIGWCIPELNIPHTNIYPQNTCTGDPQNCGTWSVGFKPAKEGTVSNAGFGLIAVTPASVTLQAIRGSDGNVNVSYTVPAK